MIVLNTSGNEYELECFFQQFKFGPFERVDIYRTDQALALGRAHKTKGIVVLNYDLSSQNKYESFESFEKVKKLAGLNELKKHTIMCGHMEKEAQKDANAKGTTAEQWTINPGKFSGKLKQVEQWIADVQNDVVSSDKKEEVEVAKVESVEEALKAKEAAQEEKPKEGRKRRGRPPKSVS